MKTNCKACGSSDGVEVYPDGHTYCFVCENYTPPTTNSSHNDKIDKKKNLTKSKIEPIPESFLPLKDRGIDKKTAEVYKVTYVEDPSSFMVHVYPYTSKGNHVANKGRLREKKDFRWAGATNNIDLFGQSAFPAGSARSLTIVEGECDAMAAYQMNGGFPVVSIRGADSAVKDIKNNYEYVNSFDDIVICFDADEAKVKPDGTVFYPGQEAALKVAEILPIGKVRILTLKEHKDPNDYLQSGKKKSFISEWWDASHYTPAKLKTGKDLWDEIINPPEFETISYPFEGLNEMTYGIRLSEFVVVNAQPKIGKSTILGEITYHILKENPESGVGLMRLEESNRDTALNLMSIHANKRLHLPDVWEGCTDEEIKSYFDATVNTSRVVVWDHFGSNNIEAVLDKIRHMKALGCNYIILDHLSIIVSDQDGDERKQLDELATKLKTLCMELNICILAVVHQNREGKIRGTAGIEQLANIVIRLERDKEHVNELMRNTLKVVVSENRFTGETGTACNLLYDQETGRLAETEIEDDGW